MLPTGSSAIRVDLPWAQPKNQSRQMNAIKKISPDPVIDAVVDVRFKSSIPKEAVYGAIYNALGTDHPKTESLPITQLPEALRLKDPSFRFKPWYRLPGNGYSVNIGPDVVTINCDCSEGYPGWEAYWPNIQRVLSLVSNSQAIETITRIGIRYISFFAKINIFDMVNVSITREGNSFAKEATSFSTILKEDDCRHHVSFKNDAQLKKKVSTPGSVIDIDTFRETRFSDIADALACIEDAHTRMKCLFFSLLKKEFLDTLNPEY